MIKKVNNHEIAMIGLNHQPKMILWSIWRIPS